MDAVCRGTRRWASRPLLGRALHLFDHGVPGRTLAAFAAQGARMAVAWRGPIHALMVSVGVGGGMAVRSALAGKLAGRRAPVAVQSGAGCAGGADAARGGCADLLR